MSWPRDGKPRYVADSWPTMLGTVAGVVYDRASCWRVTWRFDSRGRRRAAAAAAAAADRLNRIAA